MEDEKYCQDCFTTRKYYDAKKLNDLLEITMGKVGSIIKVIEYSDISGKPHRFVKDEFYGLILEEHPSWIRILRKGQLKDWVTTVHKADILTGATEYEAVAE